LFSSEKRKSACVIYQIIPLVSTFNITNLSGRFFPNFNAF
jgi:hypothetical protein